MLCYPRRRQQGEARWRVVLGPVGVLRGFLVSSAWLLPAKGGRRGRPRHSGQCLVPESVQSISSLWSACSYMYLAGDSRRGHVTRSRWRGRWRSDDALECLSRRCRRDSSSSSTGCTCGCQTGEREAGGRFCTHLHRYRPTHAHARANILID